MLRDISGNANHLTATGTNWSLCDTGCALQFDATSDKAVISSPSAVIAPTKAMTLRAWVRVPDSSPAGAVVRKSSAIVAYKLGFIDGHSFYWLVGTSAGGVEIAWPYSYPIMGTYQGKWANAVGTYDGTYSRLYIDGLLRSTSAATVGTINADGGAFSFGSSALDNAFIGMISTVQLWHDALSDKQVAALEGPVPIWQPIYYSFASAAAASIPLPLLMSSRRRSA